MVLLLLGTASGKARRYPPPPPGCHIVRTLCPVCSARKITLRRRSESDPGSGNPRPGAQLGHFGAERRDLVAQPFDNLTQPLQRHPLAVELAGHVPSVAAPTERGGREKCRGDRGTSGAGTAGLPSKTGSSLKSGGSVPRDVFAFMRAARSSGGVCGTATVWQATDRSADVPFVHSRAPMRILLHDFSGHPFQAELAEPSGLAGLRRTARAVRVVRERQGLVRPTATPTCVTRRSPSGRTSLATARAAPRPRDPLRVRFARMASAATGSRHLMQRPARSRRRSSEHGLHSEGCHGSSGSRTSTASP